MTKKLKAEFQPGGSKRHEIITKAVTYLKDPRFGLLGATTVAKPLANLAGLHSSLNGLCLLMEESMPVPDADACNCTGGGSTGCAYGIESRNNAIARAACRPQSIIA